MWICLFPPQVHNCDMSIFSLVTLAVLKISFIIYLCGHSSFRVTVTFLFLKFCFTSYQSSAVSVHCVSIGMGIHVCVCVNIWLCILLCVHMYTYVCIQALWYVQNVYECMCTHMYVYMCMCAYLYTCLCVHVYISVYTCMFVCMCVYVHAWI